jgi:hypothetical protein
MKRLILVLSSLINSVVILQAQVNEDFVQIYFQKINNFHVKSISKSYREGKPDFIIEMEYWANREKYAWSWLKKDFNDKQLELRKFSYDGENSFSLLPDKRLVVFPGHQRSQSSIYCEIAIFLPFMVGAVKDTSQTPTFYFTPTLSEFLRTAVKIHKQAEDPITKQKNIVFTGAREPLLGLECSDDSVTVSVTFNPNTTFPTQWEKSCVDKENDRRSHVWKVQGLGNISSSSDSLQSIPYAKKSLRRVFLGDYEYLRIENEVILVAVNTGIEEDLFYIDPSEALLIEDMANQKIVKVPR